MPIPVVSIPQVGPIATRPRRESIYDTEGWNSGSVVSGKITVFRNATNFANTSLALSKKKGRDVNIDGAGGQLPKGQMFHMYGITNKIRPYNVPLFTQAPIATIDVMRQIRETMWWSFYFGSSARYVTVPLWQIPEGSSFVGMYTQWNNSTVVGPPQDLERINNFDMTLNGVPTEIGELESFFVDIESNYAGTTGPTPAVDLYNSVVLKGILFRGIQG